MDRGYSFFPKKKFYDIADEKNAIIWHQDGSITISLRFGVYLMIPCLDETSLFKFKWIAIEESKKSISSTACIKEENDILWWLSESSDDSGLRIVSSKYYTCHVGCIMFVLLSNGSILGFDPSLDSIENQIIRSKHCESTLATNGFKKIFEFNPSQFDDRISAIEIFHSGFHDIDFTNLPLLIGSTSKKISIWCFNRSNLEICCSLDCTSGVRNIPSDFGYISCLESIYINSKNWIYFGTSGGYLACVEIVGVDRIDMILKWMTKSPTLSGIDLCKTSFFSDFQMNSCSIVASSHRFGIVSCESGCPSWINFSSKYFDACCLPICSLLDLTSTSSRICKDSNALYSFLICWGNGNRSMITIDPVEDHTVNFYSLTNCLDSRYRHKTRLMSSCMDPLRITFVELISHTPSSQSIRESQLNRNLNDNYCDLKVDVISNMDEILTSWRKNTMDISLDNEDVGNIQDDDHSGEPLKISSLPLDWRCVLEKIYCTVSQMPQNVVSTKIPGCFTFDVSFLSIFLFGLECIKTNFTTGKYGVGSEESGYPLAPLSLVDGEMRDDSSSLLNHSIEMEDFMSDCSSCDDDKDGEEEEDEDEDEEDEEDDMDMDMEDKQDPETLKIHSTGGNASEDSDSSADDPHHSAEKNSKKVTKKQSKKSSENHNKSKTSKKSAAKKKTTPTTAGNSVSKKKSTNGGSSSKKKDRFSGYLQLIIHHYDRIWNRCSENAVNGMLDAITILLPSTLPVMEAKKKKMMSHSCSIMENILEIPSDILLLEQKCLYWKLIVVFVSSLQFYAVSDLSASYSHFIELVKHRILISRLLFWINNRLQQPHECQSVSCFDCHGLTFLRHCITHGEEYSLNRNSLTVLTSLESEARKISICSESIPLDEHCPICYCSLTWSPSSPLLTPCLSCQVSWNRCFWSWDILSLDEGKDQYQCSLCDTVVDMKYDKQTFSVAYQKKFLNTSSSECGAPYCPICNIVMSHV